MIYLDSCAIVKLVIPEAESRALNVWLAERPDDRLVTSKLSEVEVTRAVRRSRPGVLGGVSTVLRYLGRLEIGDAVRATAAAYLDPNLRTLDAIHLATAQSLELAGGPLSAFVTYDKRLAAAAEEVGLPVVAPS
ncbi:hypothetical protein [Alloactinosynnema sp. L-07]|uniref:type II toxin-antitoxin system VapC family toxin n=1 Tax=Alloactinosynnema sp. L-07 TaxID=1653480 RepID=UPI00065EF15E|nr:type II toxin-antitoxin system VapC family toxin [Alloactinosynnema sp. L-07]CRK60054.1 hypothetical protein [Alloactinosynnema sp. L-07]